MEWISLKDAVPPFDTLVIVKDDNNKSVGRISEIRMTDDRKKAIYTWRSFEPCVIHPTHWINLPK